MPTNCHLPSAKVKMYMYCVCALHIMYTNFEQGIQRVGRELEGGGGGGEYLGES